MGCSFLCMMNCKNFFWVLLIFFINRCWFFRGILKFFFPLYYYFNFLSRWSLNFTFQLLLRVNNRIVFDKKLTGTINFERYEWIIKKNSISILINVVGSFVTLFANYLPVVLITSPLKDFACRFSFLGDISILLALLTNVFLDLSS